MRKGEFLHPYGVMNDQQIGLGASRLAESFLLFIGPRHSFVQPSQGTNLLNGLPVVALDLQIVEER